MAPEPEDVMAPLDAALVGLADSAENDMAGRLERVADHLNIGNDLLRGVPGVQALIDNPALVASVASNATAVSDHIERMEIRLDEGGFDADLEAINAQFIRVKDAAWAIARDRMRTATEVEALAGPDAALSAVETMTAVQQALSALDRLEVRGRDSAGLHLLVSNHGLDLDSPSVTHALEERTHNRLFTSSAVRVVGNKLSFVYKTAAEIGELGDNTAFIRQAIAEDPMLRQALDNESAHTVVLGHTRWASVGIVSEPNAHPLNSEQSDDRQGPYCTAVLNGDVDNFADVAAAEGLQIDDEITTDAKVIPTLMSKHLADHDVAEAFRRTVAGLEGSVAIASSSAEAASHLQLALRGSGQALYVGLAEDCFIVASEPYGLVEETSRFIRMDGETPGNLANPNASRGQIIDLNSAHAGTIEGIVRKAYDGTDLPVTNDDIVTAQITTRDIDRGSFRHYLLKEITEAPSSFRKTLRSKIVEDQGQLLVRLSLETIGQDIIDVIESGSIRQIYVIGQGTAAVAGESLARVLDHEFAGSGLQIKATPATELSGFHLRPDMSDTLAIAISQSGTTTDTNRTVDIIRGRGAKVIAIVNRRNSDLTDKADGVLYTSDGRDVEMSVASTKAFYAQIAAGVLLGCALAELFGYGDSEERSELLSEIRLMPEAMESVLTQQQAIGEATRRHTLSRRYWAVVGNGANHISARELRIKLSELCYKSIAVDVTEDKKHIDLSAEPMILVCAAGLVGSTADDVAKEVAIYRAHKAAPIVIANEGEKRFGAALDVIFVPEVHPRLAFVLSAMVGHLFGYEAARAIDSQAEKLREARSIIEQAATELPVGRAGENIISQLGSSLRQPAAAFFDLLRSGDLNGNLEANTAARLSSHFRYGIGDLAIESYQLEFGKVGTPSVAIEDLASALTVAIEELTRPIDAIKHQAKTVTVGISRSDETLLQVALAMAVLDAGAPRDRLTYQSLRALADLDPAVVEVVGFTRYRVEDLDDKNSDGTAVIIDRGGISLNIPSRTDRDPTLRGTKHRVAIEKKLLVAVGRRDNRPMIIVPEVKDNKTVGLTLL
ncbi:MAG: SIS domain-containing protein, partial [Acidimicrobiales bacterium]